jgi:uncharacterized protein (TIGR00255 family)
MIQSMTGFGRAAREWDGIALEVEARSVNHRHLDARIRLPRVLADQEPALKQRIQGELSRGKLDVTVTLTLASSSSRLEVDQTLAAQYVATAHTLVEQHGLGEPLGVASLLSLPGVTRIVEAEVDPEQLVGPLVEAIDEATAALVRMREREGAALAAEIEGRLKGIEALADDLEKRSDEVVRMARQRLGRRAEQIRQDVGLLDEARLHQEIVIAADRLDITEELVRLRSHVAQIRQTMAGADRGRPVGRRLDFLLQELGREANTVGSKAGDAPLAQDVVELKTELERIREQVQNIE